MRRSSASSVFRAFTDNPVVSRECFSHLRDGKMVAGLAVFLSLHALIAFAMMLSWRAHRDPGFGRIMFITLTCVQLVDLFLILPAFAATSICGEKERQTYDLLFLSRLRSWEILLGKWLALILYALLFNAASAPIVSLVFLVGGVSMRELIGSQIGLMLIAILLSILCLHVSSRYDSIKKSVSISYALALLLGLAVAALLAVGVNSYYANGSFWGNSVSALFGLTPTLSNWALFYGSTAYGFLAVLCLFFSMSANRLKGFGENTSTTLRIQFAVYALIMPLLFIAFVSMTHGSIPEVCRAVLAYHSAFLSLSGVRFCLEDPLIRLKRQVPWLDWKERRRTLAWFMPGSRTGVILSGILSSLSMSLIPFGLLSHQPDLFAVSVEVLKCTLPFSLAAFAFAFFLSATVSTLKTRQVIVAGTAILIAVFSSAFLYINFVFDLGASRASSVLPIHSLVFLNPFASALMTGQSRGWWLSVFGGRVSLSTASCLVYSILFVVFSALARRSWRRWRTAHPELDHV